MLLFTFMHNASILAVRTGTRAELENQMAGSWMLDPGANPDFGPYRRVAADGLKWVIEYRSRHGWLLSAGTEPAGHFSTMIRAFQVATEADDCRG